MQRKAQPAAANCRAAAAAMHEWSARAASFTPAGAGRAVAGNASAFARNSLHRSAHRTAVDAALNARRTNPISLEYRSASGTLDVGEELRRRGARVNGERDRVQRWGRERSPERHRRCAPSCRSTHRFRTRCRAASLLDRRTRARSERCRRGRSDRRPRSRPETREGGARIPAGGHRFRITCRQAFAR